MNRARFVSAVSLRRIAVAAAVATTTVVAATPAHAADTILKLDYPVTGTTFVKATGSSMSIGPATLKGSVGFPSGAMTADLALPTSHGKFTELGIVPVTVDVDFIQNGPTTGTVDPTTGAVNATTSLYLKLSNLKVAGIPTLVGSACQTKSPVQINVTSGADWGVLTGGTLSGTYTIPDFDHCLLATPLINLTVPGSGNTIALTLGTPTPGT